MRVALLSRVVSKDGASRRRLDEAGIDVVLDLAGFEELERSGDAQGRRAALQHLQGAVVGLQRVDSAFLDAAPNLEWVLRVGSGTDSVDLPELRRRGIHFASLGALSSDAVAEQSLALMFAAAKRISEGHTLVAGGGWGRLTTLHLAGRTVGIVGYGSIGRRVGTACRALGMDVIATRRRPGATTEDGVPLVPLSELVGHADVISLHVPLGPDTHHLIGAREFDAMKGAVLVNTSRGEVVDEGALVDALTDGRLFAAGLDVFATEPPLGSPLLALRNVVLSPHGGSSSDVALARAARAAVEHVIHRASTPGRERTP